MILHRDVKFKAKRAAKRYQRNKRYRRKIVGFPAKDTIVKLL